MHYLNDPKLFRQQCYINGEWVAASSGHTFDITNPSDGSVIGSAPLLDGFEINSAIEAAHRSLPEWKRKTAKERSLILKHWVRLIMNHQEDLATIVTLEQGKPFKDAKGEITYGASYIEWFAEEAKRIYGEIIPTNHPGNRILVSKDPIGVCAAITPWNFPFTMVTRKIAPAIAAGCTIVLKPSEKTPFSALALAELSRRAGLPKGVLNVVTGDPAKIGGILSTHPLIRKLTFTGSTAVGKHLLKNCAETIKKVSLELGGHAPFIIFDDADIDSAVKGAMISKYRNAGQTCVCANRFIVHDAVYDIFTQKLVEQVQKLSVADGFAEGAQLGPLIDRASLDKIDIQIQDAVSKHARILAGGNIHALGGTFFQPTVIGDVTADMRISHEETFGPVAPVSRFHTEQEAIQIANNTESGLAAYLYTKDISRIFRISESLEYGIVSVNTGIFSNEAAPFGGVKQSGIGREGSKYGIEEFVEIKQICIGGILPS
ncbi:MAG: NAD-dependent succinate-semialdehyde dehydrogenase [Proteobacteria bacterium]|nr:NAD-dependent succinate-semialdehyde dehydrogenase [Pseudomonadota bacterium]